MGRSYSWKMAVIERTLILICTICLHLNVECIQVVDKVLDDSLTNINTTTLYPVDNNVFIKSTTEQTKVDNVTTDNHKTYTVWNINATFANPKGEDDDEDDTENVNDPITTNKTIDDCKGQRNIEKEFKTNAFTFPEDEMNTSGNKLKYAKQNLTENREPAKESEGKSVSDNEFKPSPHLNSYYDTLDDVPLRHHHSETYTSPIGTPSFFGYSKDKFAQRPAKSPEGFAAFPYNYENNVPARPVVEWSAPGLQPTPTIEAPVRIPAGGLYRNPDILKDNPNSYADDNYDQGFIHDVKENPMRKRVIPWKKLLNLVTALLPVGLIVSALTPNIITIQNQEPGSTYHKRVTRRLDGTDEFPIISEECKRRLLCEIHSDRNYPSNGTAQRRPKHCYKIHCEDPHSVSRALRWLLAFHRIGDTRARGYT